MPSLRKSIPSSDTVTVHRAGPFTADTPFQVRGASSDVALKIKTEISGPWRCLAVARGAAAQGWGLSSPPRRSHWVLREGMTDAGRDAAVPSAACALSIGEVGFF
jgi:hypothetical protein